MRQNTLVRLGLLAAGIVLVGVIVVTSWLGWTGSIDGDTASLAIGGVSALASASLAIATYTTVLQNRRTIEELQKDREKPLVEDELRQLIVPFERQLDRQISNMVGENSTWLRIMNTRGTISGYLFHRELSTEDISNTVIRKLESDNQELMSQIRSHNDSSQELGEEIGSIVDSQIPGVQDAINDQYSFEIDEDDARVLSRCIIQDYSGQPRAVDELWELHGEDLRGSLDEGTVSRMEEMKAAYRDECQSLRDDLLDYKVELQQQYGISERDLAENTTTRSRAR